MKLTRTEATKHVIDKLVGLGRLDDAAFTAHNPIATKIGEDYMFNKDVGLGNFCLAFAEQQELEHYCMQRHRFDAKQQRIDWCEKNRDRVMEKFMKSGMGSV